MTVKGFLKGSSITQLIFKRITESTLGHKQKYVQLSSNHHLCKEKKRQWAAGHRINII